MNVKKMVNYFGKILMIVSLAIIIKRMCGYGIEVSLFFDPRILIISFLCAILYGGIVYCIPFIYRELLKIISGKSFPYAKIAQLYCKSNMYKYLPGNVMQYVGRNQLAIDEDVSHMDVIMATLLEITITLISSLIIVILFARSYAVEWIAINNFPVGMFIGGLIALACVAGIAVFFWGGKQINSLCKYRSRFTKRNIRCYFFLVIYNIFINLVTGIVFLIILHSVRVSFSSDYYCVIIGLFSLSFLLGYITPGVPGGIGIREALLSYFLSFLADESMILVGIILFRMVSIVGDLMGYMIAQVVALRKMNIPIR